MNLSEQRMCGFALMALENDCRVWADELRHDIGSRLAAVKMLLETRLGPLTQLQNNDSLSLEYILAHLTDAIKDCNRVSSCMYPEEIETLGLNVIFGNTIQEFKKTYPDIQVVFQNNCTGADIPGDVKLTLFRVLKEALRNAGRYSCAGRIDIAITESGSRIVLKVEDDGCGLDMEADFDMDRLKGVGIPGINERVELRGGTFQMTSSPGAGTVLIASVPTTAS